MIIKCPICDSIKVQATHHGRQICGLSAPLRESHLVYPLPHPEPVSALPLVPLLAPQTQRLAGWLEPCSGGLVGGVAGGIVGTTLGELVDEAILDNLHYLDCDHRFSLDTEDKLAT